MNLFEFSCDFDGISNFGEPWWVAFKWCDLLLKTINAAEENNKNKNFEFKDQVEEKGTIYSRKN